MEVDVNANKHVVGMLHTNGRPEQMEMEMEIPSSLALASFLSFVIVICYCRKPCMIHKNCLFSIYLSIITHQVSFHVHFRMCV